MGFCFGVRRAINLVEKEAKQRVDTSITTYGALVHNPLVVNRMEKLGVGVVERGDMSQITSGVITFTAHGVTPEIIEEAKERGFEVMDATCPLVTIIQQAARKMVEEGYTLIVFGDRNHPEVKGILGWAGGDAFATMDINDLKEMRPPKRLGIVTQSTQILEKFREFVCQVHLHFLGKTKEIKVQNTICAPTTRLQGSAHELSQECQVIVVIGGKQSANTQHLADLCQENGATTYKVEGADELNPEWFRGVATVGVTAGASTPDESIQEVVRRLQELDSTLN